MNRFCKTCKRPLSDPQDPLSGDCGGDCLRCMADAGDPDVINSLLDQLDPLKPTVRSKPFLLPEHRYCLGLLVSEMGEALAVLGNLLRFGPDTPEAGGVPTMERVHQELGDVLAAIRFARLHQWLDETDLLKREQVKLAKLLDPSQRDHLGRPLAPIPPGTSGNLSPDES